MVGNESDEVSGLMREFEDGRIDRRYLVRRIAIAFAGAAIAGAGTAGLSAQAGRGTASSKQSEIDCACGTPKQLRQKLEWQHQGVDLSYGQGAHANERKAMHLYIESLILAQAPDHQAITRSLFRKDYERRSYLRGGKDDPPQSLGYGDLGITSTGTLVWGQVPVQDTTGDVRAAAILALAMAVAYLGYLAWEGCGWGAAGLAAEIALGNFAQIGTLSSCVALGYFGNGGGGECQHCY